jgi:low affinity Fe/Cu permease
MKEWFRKFSGITSDAAGSWQAFVLAVSIVVVWFAAGFYVGFQNTFYQLLINTGTTIITFLMVFLIQNTQNRDAKALHLKLDEIIRSIHHAHNEMIDIENLSDKELDDLKARYEHIRNTWDKRHHDRETTHGQKPAA